MAYGCTSDAEHLRIRCCTASMTRVEQAHGCHVASGQGGNLHRQILNLETRKTRGPASVTLRNRSPPPPLLSHVLNEFNLE